jgi:hypothetical protein
MKTIILPALLLLPLLAHATSNGEREDLYEENGMAYAKGLYLDNTGTAEDEARSRKGEALNQSIRQRGIGKLEAHP